MDWDPVIGFLLRGRILESGTFPEKIREHCEEQLVQFFDPKTIRKTSGTILARFLMSLPDQDSGGRPPKQNNIKNFVNINDLTKYLRNLPGPRLRGKAARAQKLTEFAPKFTILTKFLLSFEHRKFRKKCAKVCQRPTPRPLQDFRIVKR